MGKVKNAAVVLAAGQGTRMNTAVPKQFIKLDGKPVICHTLKAFEDSFMDEIILVVPKGAEEHCEGLVSTYALSKVKQIIPGGEERSDSVYIGLNAVKAAGGCDYVYIHDGARPFIDADILERAKVCVAGTGACVAAMPVKDTIRIVDERGRVVYTPDRSRVWQMQTPQVFSFPLLMEAYEKLFREGNKDGVTDDAMVVERTLDHPVSLFEGSYRNIKITTPEDLIAAERMTADQC